MPNLKDDLNALFKQAAESVTATGYFLGDDELANDYSQDDDTPEPPAPEPTARDELDAYLRHYGFEPLMLIEKFEDVAAHLVALLGHIETTITEPSQTRGAQSSHVLYPERDK